MIVTAAAATTTAAATAAATLIMTAAAATTTAAATAAAATTAAATATTKGNCVTHYVTNKYQKLQVMKELKESKEARKVTAGGGGRRGRRVKGAGTAAAMGKVWRQERDSSGSITKLTGARFTDIRRWMVPTSSRQQTQTVPVRGTVGELMEASQGTGHRPGSADQGHTDHWHRTGDKGEATDPRINPVISLDMS